MAQHEIDSSHVVSFAQRHATFMAFLQFEFSLQEPSENYRALTSQMEMAQVRTRELLDSMEIKNGLPGLEVLIDLLNDLNDRLVWASSELNSKSDSENDLQATFLQIGETLGEIGQKMESELESLSENSSFRSDQQIR